MFDKQLAKLTKSRGWQELCPSPRRWYFTKRGKYSVAHVVLDWYTGEMSVYRMEVRDELRKNIN